jgi:phosphatidylserine/phosphatidylglycerophosphate/cardiolipin synthase-like enzyme
MLLRFKNRIFVLRLVLILGVLLSLSFGFLFRQQQPPPSGKALPLSSGQVAVSFSQPQKFRGPYQGGPEDALIQAIDHAVCCVDLAVYDIDLENIARALLRAASRGVKVRVVTDSDNDRGEAIDMLRAMKIPIVGDQRTALMHDKFIVIDREEVWLGSMNLTTNDAYLNDNNFLRFRTPALAVPFLEEFEEMFTRHIFGAGSAGESGATIPVGDGCIAQALFAPDDSPAGEIVRRIRAAQRTVYLMAFSFTSKDIAAALQERAAQGVQVLGVVEQSQERSNTGAQFQLLKGAKLDFRLDGNPRNMHHKVILIDRELIITGSYNFTESAEHNNDEDALLLQCEATAALFENEFWRVFESASP